MLFFLQLFASIQLAMAQGLTVQEQYDLGQKYLRRGYYTKALDQFTLIRNYYRDDPLSMKAELAIADVYYKKLSLIWLATATTTSFDDTHGTSKWIMPIFVPG